MFVHCAERCTVVLPGGTLALAGTLDMTGLQTDHPDGTVTVPITGSYTCDDLAA